MWAWLTEVPPQYLYVYSWYNGTRFEPDYKNTSWRVAQVSGCLSAAEVWEGRAWECKRGGGGRESMYVHACMRLQGCACL